MLFSSAGGNDIKDNLSRSLPVIENDINDPSKFDDTWGADTATKCIHLTNPFWIIPSYSLPKEIRIDNSNNNVSIAVYKHRLYVAFRTGPTHFASKKTGVYIISSADGDSWKKEFEFFPGNDVREPYLIVIKDTLRFYCFEGGKKITAFEPQFIQCYSSSGDGNWSNPVQVLGKGEVHWSLKTRNGQTYLSSYSGSHYKLKGESRVKLFFKKTEDGFSFNSVGTSGIVYEGGISEADFEFDRAGNLWAVCRLEDGDSSGFGSHVAYASKEDPGKWQFSDTADPQCYMSPKLFRQGNEIYLIARKQLGKKPFGKASRKKSMRQQRLINWVEFSFTPKTTALYRINQRTKQVEWLMNLPGAGDTAFPSVVRLDAHKLLIANYSSPFRFKNRSWIAGQLGKTGIYFQIISFENCLDTK